MDFVETMAFNKVEKPWHIGHTKEISFAVEHDLTPEQMNKAARLDWTIENRQVKMTMNGKVTAVPDQSALIRVRTDKGETVEDYLGPATPEWNPIQNATAAEFFNDWVGAGQLNMETAGSLKGGRYVWFLAKLRESFELFGKDLVEGYLLFTNPHKYGWSASVSHTAIRVVCWNTLVASLTSTNKDLCVKINHAREFDPEKVKATIGIGKERLAEYKKQATFLSRKRAKDEDVVEYFNKLYPAQVAVGASEAHKIQALSKESRTAKSLYEIFQVQPGHEYGEGSWWQPFNAVTFYSDHIAGRNIKDDPAKSQDNRLANAWYGSVRTKKIEALDLALEFAGKSGAMRK